MRTYRSEDWRRRLDGLDMLNRKQQDLPLAMLAVCPLAIIIGVWICGRDFLNMPTVYRSHETGLVVSIKDGNNRDLPREQWDNVLAGRYDHVWVK